MRLRRPERCCLRLQTEKTPCCTAPLFFRDCVVAALFGFFGIAASAAGIAKILFVVFLVLAALSLLLGRLA